MTNRKKITTDQQAQTREETYVTKRTIGLVKLAMFLAIIMIQTWVPFMGYVAIPPLNITIIHVTVIVATLYLGPKQGLAVGTFWGLNSLIRAYTMPTSPMYIYVFSSPLVSLLPRMIMPLIVAAMYRVFSYDKWRSKSYALAGAVGAISNTVLVLGAIVLFKRADYLSITQADMSTLWNILGGIVVVNGIPEMIFSGLVTPIIMKVLSKVR